MIRVDYLNVGPFWWCAYNTDDTGFMTRAYGFSKRQARKRLYKKMGV